MDDEQSTVVDEEEPEPTLFAVRDASWLNFPGRGYAYHAQVAPGVWRAACRSSAQGCEGYAGQWSSVGSIHLADFTGSLAEYLAEHTVCRRPACRRLYELEMSRARQAGGG